MYINAADVHGWAAPDLALSPRRRGLLAAHLEARMKSPTLEAAAARAARRKPYARPKQPRASLAAPGSPFTSQETTPTGSDAGDSPTSTTTASGSRSRRGRPRTSVSAKSDEELALERASVAPEDGADPAYMAELEDTRTDAEMEALRAACLAEPVRLVHANINVGGPSYGAALLAAPPAPRGAPAAAAQDDADSLFDADALLASSSTSGTPPPGAGDDDGLDGGAPAAAEEWCVDVGGGALVPAALLPPGTYVDAAGRARVRAEAVSDALLARLPSEHAEVVLACRAALREREEEDARAEREREDALDALDCFETEEERWAEALDRCAEGAERATEALTSIQKEDTIRAYFTSLALEMIATLLMLLASTLERLPSAAAAGKLPVDEWHREWRVEHRALLAELQRVIDYVVCVAEGLVADASDAPMYEGVWDGALKQLAHLNAELVAADNARTTHAAENRVGAWLRNMGDGFAATGATAGDHPEPGADEDESGQSRKERRKKAVPRAERTSRSRRRKAKVVHEGREDDELQNAFAY